LTSGDFGILQYIDGANACAVSLPEISSSDIGKIIILRKTGAGALTVDVSGSDVIKAGLGFDSVQVVSDHSGTTVESVIKLRATALLTWTVQDYPYGDWTFSSGGATILSDSFTDTPGTPLGSHTPEIGAWTAVATYNIGSTGTTALGSIPTSGAVIDAGTPDVTITAVTHDITALSYPAPFLVVRLDSVVSPTQQTGVTYDIPSGTLYLIDLATSTIDSSNVGSFTSGDTVTLTASGTNVTATAGTITVSTNTSTDVGTYTGLIGLVEWDSVIISGGGGGSTETSIIFRDSILDDVVESSTVLADNTLIRGDGGGNNVQDSGVTIDDSDNLSTPGTISGGSTITIDGTTNPGTITESNGALTFSSTNVTIDGDLTTDSIDIVSGGNIEVTIDNTENKVAGVFTQNDVTNNPNAINIINTGTGDSLNINTTQFVVDQSGNLSLAGTVDGVDVAQLGTDFGNLPIELQSLTSGEATQLLSIGTSTIDATQWGYLGAMNQGVGTADNVTFGDITGTLQTAAQTNITSIGTLTSLDVTNNITIDGDLDVVDPVDTAGTLIAKFGTVTYPNRLQINARDTASLELASPTGALYLNSSAAGLISFQQNSVDKLRVHTNGFVGVNNSAPAVALDVTGAITASGNIISPTFIGGDGIGDPKMIMEVPTTTNPTILPSNIDEDTGLSRSALDVASIVAGGVEAQSWTESGGVITSSINGSLTIGGGQAINRTDAGAADYNPSILTSDYLITADNTAAARAITISTEDVSAGTAANPRIFVIKDEYGNAGTYNLTVTLEGGGTIDGGVSALLSTNYNSISVYCTGANCFIY